MKQTKSNDSEWYNECAELTTTGSSGTILFRSLFFLLLGIHDLGPFEKGKGSWLPSSKKDKDRNKYTPEEPVIVSSAHSFYLSLSILLACFVIILF